MSETTATTTMFETTAKTTMSEARAAVQTSTPLGLHPLEEYEPFVGAAAIERIRKKAEPLRTLHLVHISSTFYGGGVTEILTPLTLTLNAMGIETGWRMLQGTPAFFACTTKLHNTLQGETVGVSEADKALAAGKLIA
jgi:trehalose synthase